jgi:hypothetical protein
MLCMEGAVRCARLEDQPFRGWCTVPSLNKILLSIVNRKRESTRKSTSTVDSTITSKKYLN